MVEIRLRHFSTCDYRWSNRTGNHDKNRKLRVKCWVWIKSYIPQPDGQLRSKKRWQTPNLKAPLGNLVPSNKECPMQKMRGEKQKTKKK